MGKPSGRGKESSYKARVKTRSHHAWMVTSWWQLLRALCWGFIPRPLAWTQVRHAYNRGDRICLHPSPSPGQWCHRNMTFESYTGFAIHWWCDSWGRLTSLHLMSSGRSYVCPPWVGEDQARGSSPVILSTLLLEGSNRWSSFLHRTFKRSSLFLTPSTSCYRLSCVSTQSIHWSCNLQDLKMWMYLAPGSLNGWWS